jgi:outer membrane lipoprotein SlyB
MADWSPSGNFLLPQNIDETSTTKKVALGTIVKCKHATYGSAEFIYLTGVANTAVGTWVTYDVDGASARLVADAVGPVAIAMSANVASQYGWYMIQGKHPAALCWASLSLASNAVLYATASAGLVDDAVVSGDKVRRAKADEAKATNVATVAVEIYRPEVNDEVIS